MADNDFVVRKGLVVGNGVLQVQNGVSGISIGNSTVNAVINSTSMSIVPPLAGNATLSFGTQSGNSTVNSVVNATGHYTSNSTASANVLPGIVTTGTGVFMNTTAMQITATLVINSSTFFTGNSTVNTVITQSQISSPSYAGAGVMQNANSYWANVAGIVMTTDKVNGAGVYQPLTDSGANIAISMANGICFSLAFAANNEARLLLNPTVIIEGRTCYLRVKEPSGGNCTLSFGNCYVYDSNTVPSISLANNTTSLLALHGISGTANVLVTLIAKGIPL